jgi:hypothetical protein
MINKEVRVIATLEFLTGIGLLLFWLGFFTVGLAPENPPSCYLAYEHSFPLPDTVLAVFLLASSVLLRKGKSAGGILSSACGGALVFLGLLDFSFNIQNGIYSLSILDLVFNALINAWCAAFGALLVWKLKA